MNSLKQISLSRLNTEELLKTARSISAITKSILEQSNYIARNCFIVNQTLQNVAVIDSTEQKKESTKGIQELDTRFDNLLLVIEDDLKSSVRKHEFYPTKAAAAEDLIALFAKRDRNKLFFGSYGAQGREMEALKKELYAPEYDQRRADSGIGDLFDALLVTFDELSTLLNIRLNEGNLKMTLRDAKTILRYRLEAMLSYIDVNITDNATGFKALETPLNELITEVMADYKKRVTRKENKEEN